MTDSWLRGFPSKCSVLRFGGVFCGFFSRLKPHIDMIDMIVSSSFRERRVFCIYIYTYYICCYILLIFAYIYTTAYHMTRMYCEEIWTCCHVATHFLLQDKVNSFPANFSPFVPPYGSSCFEL